MATSTDTQTSPMEAPCPDVLWYCHSSLTPEVVKKKKKNELFCKTEENWECQDICLSDRVTRGMGTVGMSEKEGRKEGINEIDGHGHKLPNFQ